MARIYKIPGLIWLQILMKVVAPPMSQFGFRFETRDSRLAPIRITITIMRGDRALSPTETKTKSRHFTSQTFCRQTDSV